MLFALYRRFIQFIIPLIQKGGLGIISIPILALQSIKKGNL